MFQAILTANNPINKTKKPLLLCSKDGHNKYTNKYVIDYQFVIRAKKENQNERTESNFILFF